MSDINLTKAVRQNLLSLQNTAKMMATTQSRLSTGNKVNSALDNPSNFFTASSLNSRAGELESLLDSMNNGVKTLEAADNGLTSISKTLDSMQSTLRQARQDKTFQTTSYSLSNLDPNSGATQQLALSGGAFTGTTNLALTTTGTGYTSTMNGGIYAAPAASAATYAGTPNIDTAGNTAGTLNVTYGGTTVSLNIGANLAAVNAGTALAGQINTALGNTALSGKLTATADATTKAITLTAANNEDASFAVSGTAATSVFGAGPTSARGSDGNLTFTVNGAAISLNSTTGATLTDAVANTNIALKAANSKFQAYNSGGKLGIRAITTDASALSIGGVDGELFGASVSQNNLSLGLTTDELVANINNSDELQHGDQGLERQRQAAPPEPVDAGSDRRWHQLVEPGYRNEYVQHHYRGQHCPFRPRRSVQYPARSARQAGRRRLVQRHQPAARRQTEDHLQRDGDLVDRYSGPGRQISRYDPTWLADDA